MAPISIPSCFQVLLRVLDQVTKSFPISFLLVAISQLFIHCFILFYFGFLLEALNEKINTLVTDADCETTNKRKREDDAAQQTAGTKPPSVIDVTVDEDNNKITSVNEELSDSNCVELEV
jgi:hypothetical protein